MAASGSFKVRSIRWSMIVSFAGRGEKLGFSNCGSRIEFRIKTPCGVEARRALFWFNEPAWERTIQFEECEAASGKQGKKIS